MSCRNKLVIKHGRIVNADGITEAHILIEDGVITDISRSIDVPHNARVINANGRLILPGGVDPHTHFEFQFMGTVSADDFFKGTRAAIAGGTTTIIDFAFPLPGETLVQAYKNYRAKAETKVCCDYGLHVCLRGWSPSVASDLQELVYVHGVNSFKIFMAYDSIRLDDSQIYEAMKCCKRLGAIPMIHAEDGDAVEKNIQKLLCKGVVGPEGHPLSRPEEVEAAATDRVCAIARRLDCPVYIVHVMGKSAVKVIRDNRLKGVQVYGEALAAALGVDGSHYSNEDYRHAAAYVMSPPLRSDPATPRVLMEMLAKNVLQATGSDNCTFNSEQKAMGKGNFSKIPNGVNGVEDRMSVIWEKGVHSGIIDPMKFVAITSTNAAKIFNLYPRKGCIAIGSDADLVVWDPDKTRTISAETHHHAIDFNVFEGMVCHGVPDYVIVRGKVCVDGCKLNVVEGFGRFLEMQTFPPYVYDRMVAKNKEACHETSCPKHKTRVSKSRCP